jgi:hypothetical protein
MVKKKKHQHSKNPWAEQIPFPSNTPRATSTPNDNGCPEFQFELDMEGPFGWNNFEIKELPELLTKLFELQRYSWQELRKKRSHLVSFSKLESSAQKRLRELKKDDLDDLF